MPHKTLCLISINNAETQVLSTHAIDLSFYKFRRYVKYVLDIAVIDILETNQMLLYLTVIKC